MKPEIIKTAELTDLSEVSDILVLNGIIYLVTASPVNLLVLNQSLEIVKKEELSSEEERYSLGILNINNYPFLVLTPQGSEKEGYLIKQPTKFNRKHLVFTVPGFKELYRIIAYNEEVSPSGNMKVKASTIIKEKAILFQENADFISVLSIDKDEFVEFAQQHSEGIPFPSVSKLSKSQGQKLITAGSFEDDAYLIIDDNSKVVLKKFSLEMNLLKECELPFGDKNILSSFTIYERDENTLVALAISIEEGKQKINMLEIKD